MSSPITRPSLKDKFTGFAKKAFEKLKHPVDSIKAAIKHEQDRIIYWSKVAANVENRTMVLNYYSCIGAACGALISAGIFGSCGLPQYAAMSGATVVGIHVSHAVTDMLADYFLKKRSDTLRLYSNTDKVEISDHGREIEVDGLLASAAQFIYTVDTASKFGAVSKALAEAASHHSDELEYMRLTVSADGTRGKISTAIRNIQNIASESIAAIGRAEFSAHNIKDPVKKAAAYTAIADRAEQIGLSGTLIPDADDPSQSIADVFLLKAAEYRQKADHITHNADPILDQLSIVVQDIQKFNKNPAIKGALHQAKAMGLPPRQAFMLSVASKPDLNAQYSTLQNNVVQALTQAQDAADTGLITVGSPDSQRMVASLEAIHDGSKLWSMSPVKTMVSKILSTLRPASGPDAGQANVNSQHSQPNGINGSAHVRTMHP